MTYLREASSPGTVFDRELLLIVHQYKSGYDVSYIHFFREWWLVNLGETVKGQGVTYYQIMQDPKIPAISHLLPS